MCAKQVRSKGLLYQKVSKGQFILESITGYPIQKVSYIKRSPISKGLLYQKVSYIKRSSISKGLLYQKVSYIKRSPISKGLLYQKVSYIKRSPISKGLLYQKVSYIKRSSIFLQTSKHSNKTLTQKLINLNFHWHPNA